MLVARPRPERAGYYVGRVERNLYREEPAAEVVEIVLTERPLKA